MIVVTISILSQFVKRNKGLGQEPWRIEFIHGTERAASRNGILASALIHARRLWKLPKSDEPFEGLVIGGWQESRKKPFYLLKDRGESHTLVLAPVVSDVRDSIFIPSLLDGWRESAFVYDPTGEFWALTSGFRKVELGQRVYKSDLARTAMDVAKFNPVGEIRVGTSREVADCEEFAHLLCDPDDDVANDLRYAEARELLAALTLHLCYVAKSYGRDATIGDITRWFWDRSDSTEAKLRSLLTYPHCERQGKPEVHPTIAHTAQYCLNRDREELARIVSIVRTNLTLFRDPIVMNNVSGSDWTISELADGNVPATVYFIVRPADRERLRPLIRLILTQISSRLTSELSFEDGRGRSPFKHRLLFLFNDFPSIRKIANIEDSLPHFAAFGVKCVFACQDLQVLSAICDEDQSIVHNCSLRVCFTPNRTETAEVISRWAGDQIVAPTSKGHGSDYAVERRRRLISPDEVMRMPLSRKDTEGNVYEGGDMIIFKGGNRPIYGKQPLYFHFPELIRRSRLASPARSDSVDALAHEENQ